MLSLEKVSVYTPDGLRLLVKDLCLEMYEGDKVLCEPLLQTCIAPVFPVFIFQCDASGNMGSGFLWRCSFKCVFPLEEHYRWCIVHFH